MFSLRSMKSHLANSIVSGLFRLGMILKSKLSRLLVLRNFAGEVTVNTWRLSFQIPYSLSGEQVGVSRAGAPPEGGKIEVQSTTLEPEHLRRLAKAGWNDFFLTEYAAFSNGKHKEQVRQCVAIFTGSKTALVAD